MQYAWPWEYQNNSEEGGGNCLSVCSLGACPPPSEVPGSRCYQTEIEIEIERVKLCRTIGTGVKFTSPILLRGEYLPHK